MKLQEVENLVKEYKRTRHSANMASYNHNFSKRDHLDSQLRKIETQLNEYCDEPQSDYVAHNRFHWVKMLINS